MNTRPFRINDVIDNAADVHVLPGACRVLGYCDSSARIWLIALPQKKPNRPLRQQDYVKAPFQVDVTECQRWNELHLVYPLKFRGAANLQLTDENLLATPCIKAKQRALRDLHKRDDRYAVVAKILAKGEGSSCLLTANEALADLHSLRLRVREVARTQGITKTTALHLVHLFWAGGSQVNVLLPRYDQCGLRGHTRVSTKKLGRPRRTVAHGLTSHAGYVLTPDDRENLAWGYALVNRERTLRDAFDLMNSRYWATHELQPNGDIKVTLLPDVQRPTFPQFIYWGRKLVDRKVKEILMGPIRHSQATQAFGKSVQDQVCMAGQLAAFDGTSTDLHLCSLGSRLKKLPAMTRSILVDVRTGLIIGVYAGWDAPSPATALRTILHAVEDKVTFCARFGITISSDDWPSFLPKTILADNGELKGSKPTEAERQFGFGIEYAPVRRGDRKGGVESQHHTDHKRLDHKLPGTTKGQRRERGQDHPAIDALWNYYEYMYELIRHILDHNNVAEVPDLAPIDMLMAEPETRPTRLNIYRWLRSQNMVADIPVDVETFRAFTLPDWPAVLHKNGVYLRADILGRKVRVARLRYRSDELVATGLMSKVKQSGSPIDVTVKIDQEDLSRAWLVSPRGLIPMRLQVKDQTFVKKMTLTEWLMYLSNAALKRDMETGERDQLNLDRTLRREAVTANARMELSQEEQQLGGRPSKQSLKSNLRANLAEERQLLENIAKHAEEGEAIFGATGNALEHPPASTPDKTHNVMVNIMADLNEEEACDER